jgi:UDP-N-acetyl-2-amino-2-deoxyglucuronate dehydrogenase
MLHWNFQELLDEDKDVMEMYSVNPPNVYGFGHQAYYESVVKSIREHSQHMVDGMQGRKSVELISAIYESIETKREVFLPFRPKFCKLGNSF